MKRVKKKSFYSIVSHFLLSLYPLHFSSSQTLSALILTHLSSYLMPLASSLAVPDDGVDALKLNSLD